MLILKSTKSDINKAAKLLDDGNLVGFPTETVFGVGCAFDNLKAYKNLNKLKRRDPDKPYTLMLGDVKDISKFAVLNKKNKAFVNKVFPGSVTVVLPAKKGLMKHLTKDGTIGIRIPDYPLTLALLKASKPLLVPSLNRSNEPPMKDVNKIKKEFNNELDALINAKCGGDIPSTVINLCGKIKILREGKVSSKKLLGVYNKL